MWDPRIISFLYTVYLVSNAHTHDLLQLLVYNGLWLSISTEARCFVLIQFSCVCVLAVWGVGRLTMRVGVFGIGARFEVGHFCIVWGGLPFLQRVYYIYMCIYMCLYIYYIYYVSHSSVCILVWLINLIFDIFSRGPNVNMVLSVFWVQP